MPEGGFKSGDEAFAVIADCHERLTTTALERLGRKAAKLLAPGPWAAVAALAAIIGAVLSGLGYMNSLAEDDDVGAETDQVEQSPADDAEDTEEEEA